MAQGTDTEKPKQDSQPGGQPSAQQDAAGTNGAALWGGKYKSADEAWSAYQDLEKKLGSQGQELGSARKQLESLTGERDTYAQQAQQWVEWFDKTLKPKWGDVERLLTGQLQQAQQHQAQQAPAQAGDPFQDWDLLPERERAGRLTQMAAQGVFQTIAPWLQQTFGQQTQALQQELARRDEQLKAKETYYQNYLDLYRKVMNLRLANPDMTEDDVNRILQESVKVLSNEIDPLELGRKLAFESVDLDKKMKKAVEVARKDWDQEQKNKQIQAVTPTLGMPPAFKVSKPGQGGVSTRREAAYKAILDKHGPGVFAQG